MEAEEKRHMEEIKLMVKAAVAGRGMRLCE
nr:MAG TPA: hypothetical protein [Caudoviricetes sp.]